ncbi:GDCCVxC domain-containing (seleno)protein [Chitinophaga vietnamensis]|uniref:GDCCVxC domain-containing (seleno)protein n=1 Tax=Chitinophaga vietnamensis TaxID=2593957 RepID=UPI0011780DA8|nr:GDCCVxC domain-containing (seleno)protein [Chitinophaga vietnamensis]
MSVNDVQLQSVITCPHCGHQQEETMPVGACVYFYECGHCHVRLQPKTGDCCVFCSYGSVKCPPVQQGEAPTCKPLDSPMGGCPRC